MHNLRVMRVWVSTGPNANSPNYVTEQTQINFAFSLFFVRLSFKTKNIEKRSLSTGEELKSAEYGPGSLSRANAALMDSSSEESDNSVLWFSITPKVLSCLLCPFWAEFSRCLFETQQTVGFDGNFGPRTSINRVKTFIENIKSVFSKYLSPRL